MCIWGFDGAKITFGIITAFETWSFWQLLCTISIINYSRPIVYEEFFTDFVNMLGA